MNTEKEHFNDWWERVGCRVLAFTAEEWAFVGWVGHKINGKSLGSIEGEIIDDIAKIESNTTKSIE